MQQVLWKKSQQDKLKDGRQDADQRHCHSSEGNRELGEKSAGEIIISLLIVFSDVRSENEGITAKWDIPPVAGGAASRSSALFPGL